MATKSSDGMSFKKSSLPCQSRILPTTALVLTVVLIVGLSSFEAASSQEPAPSNQASQPIELVPPGQEKRLYVMVRKEIPLKFKVRNENTKKWAHDLEVEVTNTSGKPIYFFHFVITLPDITGNSGIKIGFWKHYGRGELVDYSTPLEAGDKPFLPDEKYIFKLSEGQAKGWDHMTQVEGKPEPKRILIEFVGLRFGDGTGYDDSRRIDTRNKINKKVWEPPLILFGVAQLLVRRQRF
jgi:hypothetical protein